MVGNKTDMDAGGPVTPDQSAVVDPGEVSGFYVDQAPIAKELILRLWQSAAALVSITLSGRNLQAGWFGPLTTFNCPDSWLSLRAETGDTCQLHICQTT